MYLKNSQSAEKDNFRNKKFVFLAEFSYLGRSFKNY